MSWNFLDKWTICNTLDAITLDSIAKICVFKGSTGRQSCVYVTKDDDEVFSVGGNHNARLGLGDESSRDEPAKIVQLCKKQVKSIAFGWGGHMLAVTEWGDLFSWGYNDYGQLGIGNSTKGLTPAKVTTNLEDEKVIRVACGCHHSMALSDGGQIFAWGFNNHGQLGLGSASNQSSPRRVIVGRAISISCGMAHSVALLDSGEVYTWGDNKHGQLGLGNTDDQPNPCQVEDLSEVIIKQIICGSNHTLALSEGGSVYSWGYNQYGQIGNGDTTNLLSPHKINSDERFIEIAACHSSHISTGLTQTGKVFIWGHCDGQYITSPFLMEVSTTDDVFALFSRPKETWRMYSVVDAAGPTFASDMAKSFDDATTSDVKFISGGKEIYCHKAILKIRCEHFRFMFQSHWDFVHKDSIEVPYPYPLYRAFLYYLYTDSIDLCPEEAIDLLELAHSYCEQKLKKQCERIIKRGITIENAAMLYAAAIKFEAKELETFCYTFALYNMMEVTQTESFNQLDESTKSFFLKVSKARAFKK